MAIEFEVIYQELVVREDIPRIAQAWRKKIRSAIEDKLTTNPETYGKPLRRSLKGYRKLRVGDYRVVFRIEETLVKIFVIAHRAIVYKIVENRL